MHRVGRYRKLLSYPTQREIRSCVMAQTLATPGVLDQYMDEVVNNPRKVHPAGIRPAALHAAEHETSIVVFRSAMITVCIVIDRLHRHPVLPVVSV
jgi:hypothetical protein